MLKDLLKQRRIQLLIGAIIVCLAIWYALPRYTIVNAGGGKVYRIDRWSGETWQIVQGNWKPVQLQDANSSVSQSKHEIAIELVKSKPNNGFSIKDFGYTFGEALPAFVEYDSSGSLIVEGWKAVRLQSGSYFVTFLYENKGKRLGWCFDVNVENKIVREVPLGDPNYPLHANGVELGIEEQSTLNALRSGGEVLKSAHQSLWWERDPVVEGQNADKRSVNWWEQFPNARAPADRKKLNPPKSEKLE